MHDLAHLKERNRVRMDLQAEAYQRECNEFKRIMQKAYQSPPLEPWEQIAALHHVSQWATDHTPKEEEAA